jgi:hypothetical protein
MDERERSGPVSDAHDLTGAEAAFAVRLGAALRTEVSASPDFEARVMRSVRQAARPWWARRRVVSLSPLGGLALAASFAGLVALGTLAAVREGRGAPEVAAARVDTVHLVRFIIQQPGAQRVSLVGDFNGWQADAMPLASSPDGSVWSLTLPLPAGRYEYAFVVDGERWVADPAASSVRDEFGGETSVLRLTGGPRTM